MAHLHQEKKKKANTFQTAARPEVQPMVLGISMEKAWPRAHDSPRVGLRMISPQESITSKLKTI